MSWSSSNRRDATSPGWKKLRAKILKRDGHRCGGTYTDGRRCPERATDVDHIIPVSKGGTDDPSNLQSLCRWCHQQKSTAEGHAANRAKPRQRRNRPAEKHPGLL